MAVTKDYNFVVEYPKIFDREGQYGDVDRGDAKSKQKWLRELAKNPEVKIRCYFTSEEDMQDLLQDDNFQNEVLNPQTGQTVTRIKDGNEEYGIGKYIDLKNKLTDIREFPDSKTGEIIEKDYGGVPEVVVMKVDDEGKKSFVKYDYDELGAPSNGSEARIRFHPRFMRPMKIGFTKLIEYMPEGGERDSDGF
jgi:hypothetical protein